MSFKRFSNVECQYFPCHGLAEQNCLFCYCPLYFYKDCGGDPKYHKGVKDCSDCVKNHDENSYEFIQMKMSELFRIIRENDSMIYIDTGHKTDKK